MDRQLLFFLIPNLGVPQVFLWFSIPKFVTDKQTTIKITYENNIICR